MARIGFLDGDLNFVEPTRERTVTTKKKKKKEEAPAMAAVTQTVKPTQTVNTVNNDGYKETNKKYGDYKYQDYANKKNYKIYEKDNKAYYYDEKRNRYVDMDEQSMTSKEQDKKDYQEALKQGFKGEKTYKVNKKGEKEQVAPSKVADKVALENSDLTKKEKEKYTKSLIKQEKEQGEDLNYVRRGDVIGELKNSYRNVDENVVKPLARAPQSYDYGKLSQDLSMAYYNKLEGKKNNIKELEKKINNYNRFNKNIANSDNMLDSYFKNLPNQVGGMKAGVENAGVFGTAGAIAGGTIGAITTKTPTGAFVGAEKGAKLLGGAGYVKGQAENTYKLEAGATYQALLEMGVPDNIAKKEAKRVGTENAIIESGDSVLDLLTMGRASAATAALKDGLIKKYGLDALKKWGVSYATNVVSEGAQEGLQEQRSISAEKRAAEQSGIVRDDSQDLNRILEASKSGGFSALLSGAATRVGGATASGVYNNTKNSLLNQTQTISPIEKVQNLDSVQRQALSEVTNKLKRGENINADDYAVIGAINSTFDNTVNNMVDARRTQNLLPQLNQVEQIQQAVQNGQMSFEEANSQMRAINEQIQPVQETTEQIEEKPKTNKLPHSSKINEVGYHASNQTFDTYDTSKTGTGQGDNTQGKGINLASVKEAVDGVYGKNTYETNINLENAYTVDDKKLLSTFEKDFGYKTDMDNISEELKKKGYDGIVINTNGNKLYTVFDSKNATIVNNQNMLYNENTNAKGDVENEFRNIQEASRKMSDRDTEMYHSGEKQIDEGVRRGLSDVLGRKLRTQSSSSGYGNTSLVNPKTNKSKNFYTDVDAKTFHDNMEIVQKYLRNGDAVDVHKLEDYNDTKNYLSDDGLSGFAITKNGDLISVFNLGEKGYLDTIAPEVKKNAKTLDCFQSDIQPLADMYEKKLGFQKAAIMDFNYDFLVEDKGKDYADYFVKTYGEAPVVFMVQTDQNVELKHFNKDQYDEAMGYRDSFVSNEETGNTSNENIPAMKDKDVSLMVDEEGNSKTSDEMPQVLDKMPDNNKKININDFVDGAMQRLINKGHNIDKMAKQNNTNRLKTSYDRVLGVSQEIQRQIGDSQTNLLGKEYKNFKIKDAKTKKITNGTMSVDGIYKDADANGVPSKVLDEYALNKLNLDRRASGNKSWIEQFPNMTEEYSQDVINNIEKLYSDIKRVHGNLTQFYANIRNNMVDSGILSKDSQQYYDMNTPNFVHIQRVGSKTSNPSSSQTSDGVKINNQQKGIKGGNKDILPIRESTAQFTADTLSSMRKNIVGQQLGKIISPETSLEDTVINFDDINSNKTNTNRETAVKTQDGEYQLTYFENGQPKTIPIDSGIYYAMTNPQVSNWVKQLGELNQKYGAGVISRAQRGLLTDKNLFFVATNFFKDIGDAPLNSKHTRKFVKNYPGMAQDLATNGAYSTLWKNLGGEASSYFKDGRFVGESTATNIVGKAIEKVGKGVEKALTPIEKANNFIEQLPRLTEFKSTIEANGYVVDDIQFIENSNGEMVENPTFEQLISEREYFKKKNADKYSPAELEKRANKIKEPTKSPAEVLDEAMYNSAEITTNFKRGGTWTKAANRNGATFLNASVQGFDKFIRNFTDTIDTSSGKPKINSKAAVKLMLKASIFGISTSMLNDLMNDDDDDYKEIPEYQKDTYYLFKLGNHKWLRIPKGRMASIFGMAARRTKNLAKGDSKAFDGFMQQVQNQVAPNNPLTDNAFAGYFAIKDNKAWSGNKIVPDYMAEYSPRNQYDSKTDEFSKWLGKKLNMSPKKINYVLDQYSGVVGDIVLPLATKYTNTPIDSKVGQAFLAPLQNKFTTNDVLSNNSQSNFYDEYKKATTNKKDDEIERKNNPEHQAIYKYMYSQNKKIAEIKGKITETQESDLSNREKIDKVIKYQDEINKISKESIKNTKKVKKPSKNEMIIGDSHFSIANGEVKKINDETTQKAKQYGLSVGDYVDVVSHYSSFKADKDSNGNTIPGSKKQKFIDYVNSKEELTRQQKISAIQRYYKNYQ